MGIYRNDLSAIVIGDNFLPIIVIAQKSLDLMIADIAFVIYFVTAINDFLCTQCSKLGSCAMSKFTVSIKSCCNLKNLSWLCLIPRLSP